MFACTFFTYSLALSHTAHQHAVVSGIVGYVKLEIGDFSSVEFTYKLQILRF